VKSLGDVLSSFNLPDDPQPGSTGNRRAPDEICPICKGKGYLVLDVPAGHPDFSKVFPCRCTQARMAVERADKLRAVSNLGQLTRMTFDNFIPGGVSLPPLTSFNLQQAYDLAREFARNPEGWLVLRGGYGCGKTHLAAAIANQRLSLGHPVMFVVVPDLLDYLRGAFAPDSTTSLDARLEAIRETPLLILDDLGSHNSTAWAQEKLFQIVNHRYNGRLPTVITSNQRLEDLDPRVTSRLADVGLSQLYEISAPDYRHSGSERGGDISLSSLSLYRDQTFESFSLRSLENDVSLDKRDKLRSTVAKARSYAENPEGWFVLSGSHGCGKTHLAAAIANYQLEKGRLMPVFMGVADLLDHLRATFSPSSSTTLDKVFEQVRSAPLLILDDLSTASATPWASEKLFQLLNYRYVARLATVITTADQIEDIEKVEPRLAVRLFDKTRCVFVLIEMPSYYRSRTGAKETPPGEAPESKRRYSKKAAP
jgi:DNA replication protein DnaC